MSIRSFTVGTSTGAGFVTLNKPTGLANGDVLVIALASGGSISATTTWPSGFSAERGFATNSTSAQRLRYATKKITDATSEPTTYTVNFSPSDHASAIAIAVQGQGDFNVGNTTGAGSGTTTSIAVPGVTPPDSSELIWLAATYPSSLTYTPPSGMTTIGGTTTQYSSITAASKVHSTGATGTQTGSTNSAGNGMGVMLAIEPPPAAPTLSAADRDTITSTGVRVTATSNIGSGTFYAAVSTSATAPSAAQIKAGSGGSIVAAGSAALASGANAVSVTGLSPSTTYYAYAVANNGNDSNVVSTASFTTAATAATITGTTGSANYQGTFTVNVTNAGASQGTGGVTIGGVACSVVSWSDTAIQVTVARGTNKYGQALNIVVTKDGGLVSAPYSLTGGILPQSGWGYVDITSPNETSSLRLTATPDIVAGDQIAWQTYSTLVSVYDDATFSAAPAVANFQFEVWTTPDGWGSTATQIVGVAFAAVPAVATATVVANAALAVPVAATAASVATVTATTIARTYVAAQAVVQPVVAASALYLLPSSAFATSFATLSTAVATTVLSTARALAESSASAVLTALLPAYAVTPIDRRYVVRESSTASTTNSYAFTPDAVLDFQWDWSQWLGADVISSYTLTVPTGVTKNSDSVTSTAVTAWVRLTDPPNAVVNTTYSVKCKITTIGGRTDTRTIKLMVADR